MRKKQKMYSIRWREENFKVKAYSREQAIFKISVKLFGVLKSPKLKRKAWNTLKREARVNWKR